MRYYDTKTFKLRDELGDHFVHYCSYCGLKAEQRIETADRDSTYHYHCNCPEAAQEKTYTDQIIQYESHIRRLREKIRFMPVDDNMIKLRNYESDIKRVNYKYFGGE
jgi:hypothetical protein